jgi:energy-coupling factor transport system permease protein
MRVFAWYQADSFLHRLNPLTKLGLCFPTAVVVALAREPLTPLLMAVLAVLTTHWLGRIPWRVFVRPLLFFLILGFGLFWTTTVFYAGAGSALQYGLTVALRLAAILAMSTLFVVTTEPTQFVRALIHQARLSPRLAYSIFAAYRFVPLVEVEFSNIRAAHQLRGGVGRRGPLARIQEIAGYAIPLLALAVRRGERVALAMESRAFGALAQRTYYRETTLGRADLAFAVAGLVVLGMLAGFSAGLGRA